MLRFTVVTAVLAAGCSDGSLANSSSGNDAGLPDLSTVAPSQLPDMAMRAGRDLSTPVYPSGSVVWTQQFPSFQSVGGLSPGSNHGAGTAAFADAVDSAGNLVVAGYAKHDSGLEFTPYAIVFKIDRGGTLLWDHALASDNTTATSLALDSSDNIYVAAYGGPGGSNLLVKYDPMGNEKWRASNYNSSGWQQTSDNSTPTRVILDPSGGLFLVEAVEKNRLQPDELDATMVTRFDSGGNVQWQKLYSDLAYPIGAGLDGAGHLVVGANTYPRVDGQAQSLNQIGTIDSSGMLLSVWSLPSNVLRPMAVINDGAGGLIVGGSYYDANGNFDRWLGRVDGSGALSWSKPFAPTAGSLMESIYAVAIAANGKLVLAGSARTSTPGTTASWTAVADGSGNILWEKTDLPSGSVQDSANAVAVDPAGFVYAVGVLIDDPSILFVTKYAL